MITPWSAFSGVHRAPETGRGRDSRPWTESEGGFKWIPLVAAASALAPNEPVPAASQQALYVLAANVTMPAGIRNIYSVRGDKGRGNKYPKIAPNFGPDSRRGKGRIVVLCNPCRNAAAGPKDKHDWIVIFSVAVTVARIRQAPNARGRC